MPPWNGSVCGGARCTAGCRRNEKGTPPCSPACRELPLTALFELLFAHAEMVRDFMDQRPPDLAPHLNLGAPGRGQRLVEQPDAGRCEEHIVGAAFDEGHAQIGTIKRFPPLQVAFLQLI